MLAHCTTLLSYYVSAAKLKCFSIFFLFLLLSFCLKRRSYQKLVLSNCLELFFVFMAPFRLRLLGGTPQGCPLSRTFFFFSHRGRKLPLPSSVSCRPTYVTQRTFPRFRGGPASSHVISVSRLPLRHVSALFLFSRQWFLAAALILHLHGDRTVQTPRFSRAVAGIEVRFVT